MTTMTLTRRNFLLGAGVGRLSLSLVRLRRDVREGADRRRRHP